MAIEAGVDIFRLPVCLMSLFYSKKEDFEHFQLDVEMVRGINIGYQAFNKFSILKFKDFFMLPEARILFKYYFINAAEDRMRLYGEMIDKEVSVLEAAFRLGKLAY